MTSSSMSPVSPSQRAPLARIVRLFWRTSVEAELEYRWNFLFSALGSVGNSIGALFSLTLLYRGGGFSGWSFADAVVVVGLFTILTGFVATFLSPNLSRIVQHVEKGTLDFILLKPLDAQLHVSVRVFAPWGLPEFSWVSAWWCGGLAKAWSRFTSRPSSPASVRSRPA